MTPLVTFVLYGWVPVTLYLFVRYPPQRALVISFIAATLFLPQAAITLPAIGSYTKITAACFGCLLATLIFDPGRLSSFKIGWLDLPMLIWCLCPIPSQLLNNLSPISPTIGQILQWGLPYFLARIYLSNLSGVRELAMGIFYGGLIYTPFCLYESRMSPQLHRMVYGFTPRLDFGQAIRLGGYRPTVFMEHGLAVGMWMMAAALLGVWLWQTKVIKKVLGFPAKWIAVGLTITFILCRSTGAYIYMVLGVFILLVGKQFRTALFLFLLIAGVSTYLYMGADGSLYSNPYVVKFINSSTDVEDRSQSLAFRIQMEEVLSQRARQQIIFGWGGSGGNHVTNEWGETTTVTDSLWIIAYGVNGLVGLISFTAVFLLPALSFSWLRYPARSWSNPKVAPVAGLGVVIALYMLDSSLNAFPNAVFVLGSGAISGLLLKPPESIKVKSSRSPPAKRSPSQRRLAR
ncbi:MAG TPA: O-antigen ligase domain-containing protein [Kamptonema sp.]|nr:O-antigen ligase domain-containing protein [Kamptonema sp.]